MTNFLSGLTQAFDSSEQKALNQLVRENLLPQIYIESLRDEYGNQSQLILSRINKDAQFGKIPDIAIGTCGKIKAILKQYNLKI